MKRKRRKKWKERKEKDENKEKNKKEEETFPVEGRREVKREKKQFLINERKRTEILQARLPLKIILNWQYPIPHEQRGKDRNTQLPLQKYYPRENPIGP